MDMVNIIDQFWSIDNIVRAKLLIFEMVNRLKIQIPDTEWEIGRHQPGGKAFWGSIAHFLKKL